jgi:hypothetical protein
MNLQGNSISAPYFNSKRANYYVKNFAGGFSKLNDRSNTVVVYPNGIAKKSKNFLFFKLSPKVTKGSTIRVSSKIKKGGKRLRLQLVEEDSERLEPPPLKKK